MSSNSTRLSLGLQLDRPGNGHLILDVEHDPGHVVLDVQSYVEPEELDLGVGMVSLDTADLVTLRDCLSVVIRHDAEQARRVLADPEATEESRARAREILAATSEDSPLCDPGPTAEDCKVPGRYVTLMAGEVWRLDEGDTTGWQRWDEDAEEWDDETDGPTGLLHYVPPASGA